MIRRLFSGISLPWYEIGSGYASAVLIVLLALLGALIILRKKQPLNSMQIGLLSFGALYLVTAPLVLTPWGAESGRRSWVYSFISLALLSGFALRWLASSDFIGYRRYKRLGTALYNPGPCSTSAWRHRIQHIHLISLSRTIFTELGCALIYP